MTQILVITSWEGPRKLETLPLRIAERSQGLFEQTDEATPLVPTLERFVAMSRAIPVWRDKPPVNQFEPGAAIHFGDTLLEWCTLFPRPPRAILFTHPALPSALGLPLDWVVHFAQIAHVRQVPLYVIPHPWRHPKPDMWGERTFDFLIDLVEAIESLPDGRLPLTSREFVFVDDPLELAPDARPVGTPLPPERWPKALAQAFLRAQLADGPKRATTLYELWHSSRAGSRMSLYRGAHALGVIMTGRSVAATWRLPPT